MKTRNVKQHKDRLVITLCSGALSLAANQAQAVNYSFSDLGTIGLATTQQIVGAGINNSGHISGGRLTIPDLQVAEAVIYNGTQWVTVTPTSGQTDTFASSINDSDQMTGYANVDGAYENYNPTRWDGTTSVALGRIPGDSWFSTGSAINNVGQVAGYAWNSIGAANWHAIRWDGTTANDLGTLGGSSSSATDLNDLGQVVGNSFTTDDDSNHATFWDSAGVIKDLGTLGGLSSTATSINSLGQIVGSANDINDVTHAVIWNSSNAAPISLGTLGGEYARALDINDAGQILGQSKTADGDTRVALWENGQIFDLDTFFPSQLAAAGWQIASGTVKFNNLGMITGQLSNTNGSLGAFLMTPTAVPVPGAVWLFGSALAGFVSASRHKWLLN